VETARERREDAKAKELGFLEEVDKAEDLWSSVIDMITT